MCLELRYSYCTYWTDMMQSGCEGASSVGGPTMWPASCQRAPSARDCNSQNAPLRDTGSHCPQCTDCLMPSQDFRHWMNNHSTGPDVLHFFLTWYSVWFVYFGSYVHNFFTFVFIFYFIIFLFCVYFFVLRQQHIFLKVGAVPYLHCEASFLLTTVWKHQGTERGEQLLVFGGEWCPLLLFFFSSKF